MRRGSPDQWVRGWYVPAMPTNRALTLTVLALCSISLTGCAASGSSGAPAAADQPDVETTEPSRPVAEGVAVIDLFPTEEQFAERFPDGSVQRDTAPEPVTADQLSSLSLEMPGFREPNAATVGTGCADLISAMDEIAAGMVAVDGGQLRLSGGQVNVQIIRFDAAESPSEFVAALDEAATVCEEGAARYRELESLNRLDTPPDAVSPGDQVTYEFGGARMSMLALGGLLIGGYGNPSQPVFDATVFTAETVQARDAG